MSKFKGTPGPWRALDETAEAHPEFTGAVVLSASGKLIADCNIFHRDGRDASQVNEANARLIAAAPALLAACKEAVDTYEWIISDHPRLDPDGELPPRLKRLKAALAAAEGK